MWTVGEVLMKTVYVISSWFGVSIPHQKRWVRVEPLKYLADGMVGFIWNRSAFGPSSDSYLPSFIKCFVKDLHKLISSFRGLTKSSRKLWSSHISKGCFTSISYVLSSAARVGQNTWTLHFELIYGRSPGLQKCCQSEKTVFMVKQANRPMLLIWYVDIWPIIIQVSLMAAS